MLVSYNGAIKCRLRLMKGGQERAVFPHGAVINARTNWLLNEMTHF